MARTGVENRIGRTALQTSRATEMAGTTDSRRELGFGRTGSGKDGAKTPIRDQDVVLPMSCIRRGSPFSDDRDGRRASSALFVCRAKRLRVRDKCHPLRAPRPRLLRSFLESVESRHFSVLLPAWAKSGLTLASGLNTHCRETIARRPALARHEPAKVH